MYRAQPLMAMQRRNMFTVMKNAQRQQQINKIALVSMQQRRVHARGYNDWYDVPYYIFHEINGALQSSKNTTDLAFVLNHYSEHLTDFQIGYAFMFCGDHKLPKDKNFWEVILPKAKEQIPTLDRECTQSMMMFIKGAGEMQLQDNELWEALESKLVDEGLLRYFSIDEWANILYYFARCGRGSDDLIEQLENNFIKHRKALAKMPTTLQTCKRGFGQLSKKSEIIKKILEDPTTDLPQIE